jgi:hypothetical protein
MGLSENYPDKTIIAGMYITYVCRDLCKTSAKICGKEISIEMLDTRNFLMPGIMFI